MPSPFGEHLQINFSEWKTSSIESLKEYLNKYLYTDNPIRTIYRSITKDATIQFEFVDGNIINFSSLSSGQKMLISLYYNVYDELKNHSLRNPHNQIICMIEEPESSLHTFFQKEIGNVFEKIASEFKGLIFIISTHSTSLLANIDKRLSKIYLIENGHVIDEGRNQLKISKYLGFEVGDLDYPENICLVEEASLQKILDSLKQAEILKNWSFISTSGINKIPSVADRLRSIKEYDLLVKCNLFYQDSYCIITDHFDDDEQSSKGLSSLRSKLEDDRFIMLSKNALEDYYPEELKAIFDKEMSNIDQNDHASRGILKLEFAQKLVDLIKSESDKRAKFSEIFHHELDFLLKELN